jgi:DNA invertase Pin-like site-specific DNA recombinase
MMDGNPKPRRGYSYLRYSTQKQRLGDSQRRQIAATAAYAAELGIDLDETLIDAASAYHAVHRAKGHWGTLVKRIETGEIARDSVLFVEALDRMSREKPRIALAGFLDIINAGVEIITTIDRQRFTQSSIDANDGQLHMSLGIMRGNHQESVNKAVRVKEAWAKKRYKVNRNCPGWLVPNAARTAYDEKPGARETLKLILQMCIDGVGIDQIVYRLNTEPRPAWGKKGWTDSYIRKIIVERTVRGELKLGERINPGQERKPGDKGNRRLTGETITCYPAMVTEAQWQAANDALAGRRRTGGQHAPAMINLFGGGLTVCECGSRMKLKSKGMKGPNRYLQCARGKRGLCSNRLYFNYQRIETQILKVFGAAAFRVDDHSEQQLAMRERIAAVRHAADELAAEYQAANRIARKNPGPLAEASLAEVQAEHQAKMKLVADLELAYPQNHGRAKRSATGAGASAD